MQIFARSRSTPYYSGIGYMYRIPRYDSMGRHVSSEIREDWLKEQVDQRKHYSVFSVCGELSSVELIETITTNSEYEKFCDSYEVIFGPKIESQEIKNRLKILMEDPRIKSKLRVYSYLERPPNHGIKLGDRLFCEEQHPIGTKYNYATIVERAEKGIQNKFMSSFYGLKASSEQVTLENIDLIETMH